MVAVPAAMAGKLRVLGFLVARELEVIDGLMGAPKRPLLAVMGGAKVSDKVKFIHALLGKVDHLLIGGKMTYTFLKAGGVAVGNMRIADEEVAAAMAAVTVVGGGETAEAVEQFGFDARMTHVPTGGRVFLANVEGEDVRVARADRREVRRSRPPR